MYTAWYVIHLIISRCKEHLEYSSSDIVRHLTKEDIPFKSLKLNLFLSNKTTHFKKLREGIKDSGQNKLFPILSSQVVILHHPFTNY